jgi:hypothetical protein
MPPWFIDKNIGIQHFKDDPSLSDAEIAAVAAWVDNGAPRGDPSDMPPAREFADAAVWQIGKPDLVIRYPAMPVPAEGPDMFGAVYSPLELERDRYIKAIQHRPVGDGSRQVIHHALSFAVDQDEFTQMPSVSGHFLMEYASGKNGEVYPEDSGVLLQAGKKMKLDYHLHPVGEPVDAIMELGIVFHPEEVRPKHIRWSKQLGQHVTDIDIPAGTILHIISWHDNTAGNRGNPDPKNWVGNGRGRTIDEMAFAWIGWYDLTDEEYEQELAARKARRAEAGVTTAGQQ